eukprot:scaffold8161_cov111-Cylindrotheca_fusiformis.AAC.3
MFRRAMQSVRRTAIQAVVVVGVVEVTTHLPSQGKSSEVYHYVADEWGIPMLRRFLPAEMAHHLALEAAQWNLTPTHRPSKTEQKLDVSTTLWNGKTAPNCIGLAAGFDKDGVAIPALFHMGFGFLEIGSVCLKAQPGNPSPRMFRLVADQAIINRYGFNSLGADVVEENLKKYRNGGQDIDDDDDVGGDEADKQEDEKETNEENKLSTGEAVLKSVWKHLSSAISAAIGAAIAASKKTQQNDGLLGINLGKNKDATTPLRDYQTMIRKLGPYADYLVINVSCPNVDMEDLGTSTASMEALLVGCQTQRDELDTEHPVPILVKLSPDLTDEELKEICDALMKIQIDGIILTNTTSARPDSLLSPNRVESGGLSGRPLRDRSTECIRKVYQWTEGSIPIIGVGGVFTGKDAYDKLRAGASLVQIYSSMVYRGPGMVSKIRDELAEIMIQNGHRSLEDVVGSEHSELFWKLRERRIKGEPVLVLDTMDEEAKE